MRTDAELKKAYTITLAPDSLVEVVFLVPTYDDLESDRMIELQAQDFLALVSQSPDKQFKVLIDIQRIEQNANLTPKMKELYQKLARHPQIEKVAVVGNTGMQMIIIKFILGLLGEFRNIKWFPNRDEAMLWLKQ